jgi:hypothetical protein
MYVNRIDNASSCSIISAVVLRWHHQLTEVLLIQDRLVNIDDQSTGIDEEIHFWHERLTDLHSIRSQMQRIDLRNLVDVLLQSNSAYIQQYLHTQQDIHVDHCSIIIDLVLK